MLRQKLVSSYADGVKLVGVVMTPLELYFRSVWFNLILL